MDSRDLYFDGRLAGCACMDQLSRNPAAHILEEHLGQFDLAQISIPDIAKSYLKWGIVRPERMLPALAMSSISPIMLMLVAIRNVTIR